MSAISGDDFTRWLESEQLSLVKAICSGFEYNPGHSDLDDEQPIHVSMTLGDYRRAKRLQHELLRREQP